MKIKVKENHAGIMTLIDGSVHNYGVIRITQNMNEMVYYTGKGLREIFKPNITNEEKQISEHLKTMTENDLIKSGHVAKIKLAEVKELN